MRNELVEALWKRIDQLSRASICPSDDLLAPTPFNVPDAESATMSNKRGPALKVGASAGPCPPQDGAQARRARRRDAENGALLRLRNDVAKQIGLKSRKFDAKIDVREKRLSSRKPATTRLRNDSEKAPFKPRFY